MTERAKKLLLLYYKQSRKIRRVSGLPPLTFKAKKAGTLKNYRIYGQTVDGESVGDRTGNLFDINSPLLYNASISKLNAEINTDMFPYGTGDSRRCIFIPVEPNTTYTFSCRTAGDKLVIATYNQRYTKAQLDLYTTDNCLISDGEIIFDLQKGYTLYTFTTPATTNMIGIYYQLNISPTGIMLNEGSTALPYEPYGYKVPVTVSNGTDTLTTPIYLPEPIKMVGDEAEYIDYEEQKQHRVRKNLFNIETDIISLGFQYGTVAISGDLTVKGFFKECEPNTAYTISRKTSSNNRFSIGFSAEEPSNTSTVVLLSYTTPLDTSTTSLTSISPANAKYICCYLSNRGDDITEALEIMLEKNDRATDYEPYITNTELDVTLPALPTLSGTNTLTVGTEVQPSGVEIKGRIKAAGGD